jgi:hypothetical protein
VIAWKPAPTFWYHDVWYYFDVLNDLFDYSEENGERENTFLER